MHPRDLKNGDTFYENGYGRSIQFTVTSDVIHENGQWKWSGVSNCGSKVDFLTTDGYEHYGPKISKEADYVR